MIFPFRKKKSDFTVSQSTNGHKSKIKNKKKIKTSIEHLLNFIMACNTRHHNTAITDSLSFED